MQVLAFYSCFATKAWQDFTHGALRVHPTRILTFTNPLQNVQHLPTFIEDVARLVHVGLQNHVYLNTTRTIEDFYNARFKA